MGETELTALHIAAYKGNSAAIKKLLNAGADPRISSKHGMDIIHSAAQNNQAWPIVYFKDEYNMNVDSKDVDGNTPLHWACHFGALQSASYLLKWSRSINIPNNSGETPLHLAVMTALANGVTRLVRLLCFNGADRNATDNSDRTPLQHVLSAEQEEKYTPETIRELKHILAEPKECMFLMVRIPIKKQ